MKNIGKGIASLGVCGLAAYIAYLEHGVSCDVFAIMILGFIFIW